MFIPKIALTLSLNAQELTIQDITGNTTDPVPDPTGYVNAATYYPSSNTVWHKLVKTQLLGTLGIQNVYTPTADANFTSSAIVGNEFVDGVWLITEFWRRPNNEYPGATMGVNYTIDTAKLVLTRTSGTLFTDSGVTPGIFEGVYGISLSSNPSTSTDAIIPISSVTSTTLTLASPLTGATTNSLLNPIVNV